MTDKEQISARYRAYCDVCQSGELDRLQEFWTLPAMFTVDLGDGKTEHKLMQSYDELKQLYGREFGASSGVDKTTIDKEEVKFYGTEAATVETSLRHFSRGKLHDQQDAFYTARKIAGKWMFEVHVSIARKSADA